MAIRRISRAFKDISLSFDPHPITKDLPVLKNEATIRRSMRYLQSSGRSSADIASVISDQILISIENFEPRVDNLQVEVLPRPDSNEFEVTVVFDIIGQEFPTQEYSFLLEATR